MTKMYQLVVECLIAGVILWGASKLPIDGNIYNLIKVIIIVVMAIRVILALASMIGG